MKNKLKGHRGILLIALCLAPRFAVAQSTELKWQKVFAKEISWYVRTSPGILLVKSEKGLTALDGSDGRQLWELPDVEPGGINLRNISGLLLRGKNILEVPGLGIVLINRVKLPGDSSGRLIALNLVTGERLWDEPELDDLTGVVPLDRDNEIILVSTRLQRKVMAGELVATAAARTPLSLYVLPYPYRLEFQRLNAITGKVLWNAEYPRLFRPGSQSFSGIEGHVYLYGHTWLGSVDGANGTREWEDSAKMWRGFPLPLTLGMTNNRLVYGLQTVHAVDPYSNKLSWEIDDLGRITGMLIQEDLVVAIGEKNVAAVDAKSGAERWRAETNGHATNLIADKATDTILYVDGKGLHRLERTTGKSLLNAHLEDGNHPYVLRSAGPAVAVAISNRDVRGYDLETGKQLFRAGKLVGFFPSIALQDHWPMTAADGEDMTVEDRPLAAYGSSEVVPAGTLLSGTFLDRIKEGASAKDGSLDAYETEDEKGDRTAWWVDATSKRQIVFRVSDEQRDISRPMGVIFGVHRNQIWGATYAQK